MSKRLARPSLSVCAIVSMVLAMLLPILAAMPASAQALEPRYYDMGTPSLRDIWVDPARGDDNAAGDSRAHALRTIIEAWNRIPSGSDLTDAGTVPSAPPSISYRPKPPFSPHSSLCPLPSLSRPSSPGFLETNSTP